MVYVDLDGAKGSEKQGFRPCVIVQNNVGNRFSPLTIVLPLTDQRQDKQLPVQVAVSAQDLWPGTKDGLIEGGHVRTIDRDTRIDEGRGVLCQLPDPVMARVDAALRVSLGL